jgi:hypothetical protein
MTSSEWTYDLTRRRGPVRKGLSTALRLTSRWLARWARRLAQPLDHRATRGPPRGPVLEFYAEAGAPEGALYVDGQLVGHLSGVKRL